MDSFDAHVPRDRHRCAAVSDDARPAVTRYKSIADHCLHGFQPAVCRVDDARLFDEVPRDLEEAALVDGDSRMGALVRVVLPLVAPGLAATAVFCLIVSWNEFLFALVLTQTDASMTLPVGIAGRVTQYEIKWGVMSAAGAVAIVPILVFAMAMQKYLVRGLSLGAVKG